MLRIGIIANSVDALTLDRAGGFVHLIETIKRWDDVAIIVMAPENTEQIFRKYVNVDSFIGIRSFGIGTSVLSMLLRAVASISMVGCLKSECDVVMAISHSIPDTLPAVLFGGNAAAVQLWHFIGNPLARGGSLMRNVFAFANELVGRALASRCKGYILGSMSLAREMHAVGRPFTYITTNGIDENLPEPSASRRGSVFVGRLHPAKGIDDLIDIWALVHDRLPQERLTIVGRGIPAYRVQLERRIDALHLRGFVEIRDDVDNEEKLHLLAASKLFVFPSKEEGWGIALAEAMAVGLPCVTYELQPFADIFPKARLHSAIGDTASFAQQVVRLLSDVPLWNELSEEALEQAKEFSWSRAAEIELRALREIAR